MKKIEIVTTQTQLFADSQRGKCELVKSQESPIASGIYWVRPEACKTKLGRWLSEKVTSTRFNSQGGACTVKLKSSQFDKLMATVGKAMCVRTGLGNKASAKEMVAKTIAELESIQKLVNDESENLFTHVNVQFNWPIYGSRNAEGASSVEELFDICARQIGRMGALSCEMNGSHFEFDRAMETIASSAQILQSESNQIAA